ncbi:hypothetical protein Q1695_008411 [Nippostrongylus brasiliensis]|nr:hypothetical protein Q1695_008411 [Nippostrongylus brasiliensis]
MFSRRGGQVILFDSVRCPSSSPQPPTCLTAGPSHHFLRLYQHPRSSTDVALKEQKEEEKKMNAMKYEQLFKS